MNDRKEDEFIIELTEVVEEAPSSTAGEWMETTPPPSPEKKIAEPPKVARKVSPINSEALKDIPESPLKKFLLAEEEPTLPDTPPNASKPLGFSRPGPQPVQPAPEPPRPAPRPPRIPTEPPQMAAGSPMPAPAPPRPSPPNIEAEMQAIREAMLARVEKWVAQDGVRVLERVGREIFPKIAEEMIRKEIEKLKTEAEEKE